LGPPIETDGKSREHTSMSRSAAVADRYGWDIKRSRPPWKQGLVAMGLTVVLNAVWFYVFGLCIGAFFASREDPTVQSPVPPVVFMLLGWGSLASVAWNVGLSLNALVKIVRRPSCRNLEWAAHAILLALTMAMTFPAWSFGLAFLLP
jgi:hypothetical protein